MASASLENAPGIDTVCLTADSNVLIFAGCIEIVVVREPTAAVKSIAWLECSTAARLGRPGCGAPFSQVSVAGVHRARNWHRAQRTALG
jgi:hypothetical protein